MVFYKYCLHVSYLYTNMKKERIKEKNNNENDPLNQTTELAAQEMHQEEG